MVPYVQSLTKIFKVLLSLETEKAEEEVNKCDIPIQHHEVFLMRSSDKALLDSCCSANVMGKQWKDIFIDAMSNEDKAEVDILKVVQHFDLAVSHL